MFQVRVHNFSVSLDGFGTGEGQQLEAPFGALRGWWGIEFVSLKTRGPVALLG